MTTDWKALRARVAAGMATQEDSAALLLSANNYRARLHAAATKHYRENAALWKKVNDFEFTLKLAQRAIDPDHNVLGYSQVDLFSCVLEPERLRDTREKVAAQQVEALERDRLWRLRAALSAPPSGTPGKPGDGKDGGK